MISKPVRTLAENRTAFQMTKNVVKAPEGEKAEKEATIQAALKELKSYKPGYQKTGGDNLQEPKQAAKYEDFYKKDKDLSYKASKKY